jgi:hypothetical protein
MAAPEKGYLASHGRLLLDAGYPIIPIRRGKKHPGFDGWEKTKASVKTLERWLSHDHADSGVGILAANVPGVDLDIYEEDLALQMERFVINLVDLAPVRVGQAPKRLLMFRTDIPFSKVTSKIFIDHAGNHSRVEILGDGQQFVAFHIHPDTGRPYQWLHGDGPHVTPYDELPELDVEQAHAIVAEFERLAEEAGWQQKPSGLLSKGKALARVSRIDHDDPFAADAQKVDIAEDELHAKLLLVPGAEDYDTWFQIGMALYHQYDGGERGLELWDEWSSTADNYDRDALDEKWPTFDISEKGRAPVTARIILKLAKAEITRVATEVVGDITTRMKAAETVDELKAVAKDAKQAEIDAPTRDILVGLLRQRFAVLTGQPLALKTARDMLRFENPTARELPRWLVNWVYMDEEDRFYNLKSRVSVSTSAFNMSNGRFMLTKADVLEGRALPEQQPGHVAMNLFQIPSVQGRRYMPGIEELFSIDGVKYANLYTEASVPEVPEKLTKADRQNIEIVKHHFGHLFSLERDRELLADWMAYVVQNPGKRVNWAVLMQGTEGDGKSFFSHLMAAMIGQQNVFLIDPKSLEGEFNGFAEGHQVGFIEEVKMHGHNRYDVLNRIKPLITNPTISIRRMRTDAYLIPNMTSYMLATNYRDALPLNDSDSRYFVLFSRFQTRTALHAFNRTSPNYYVKLYRAIEESAGAIRGWFLDRQFGTEFSPTARAPLSNAKAYMSMMSKSEDQQAIEEILATSGRGDLCKILLNATSLADELVAMDIEIPKTSKLPRILSDMGFTKLGRVKVEGKPQQYWSQSPDLFVVDGELQTDKLRDQSEDDL